MSEITEGAAAPDFDMPTDGGGRARLKDFAGRRVVLYFYPKADTPGCTNEAKDFTDHIAAFAAADAVVIGVSKDPVKKLDKFKSKYDLKVALASDEETDVCERYGVWVEKSMYGRTYMGVERSTFLIGPDGRIARVWRKVSVKGHAQDVLETVQN